MKKNCHQVGFGFDSHAYSSHGTLVLGGIKFPDVPALRGHSDGDALLHALIDALLGGAGLGDIGDFFPDSSPKYKEISSKILLRDVVSKVTKKGFSILHVDLTVVAEKPRLSKVKSKMKKSISRLLKISSDSVNLKAKTAEGLQIFSPPGGVLVWAVATLQSQ